MRLKSIGISNFKAFGPNPQTVPIRPITLVFGPNSAGKSSLLHSVLWLNHVLRTGDCDVTTPLASLGRVDLGGFSQIQHRNHTESGVRFNLQFSCDPTPINTGKAGEPIARLVDIELTYGNKRLSTASQDAIPEKRLTESRLIFDGRPFLKTSGDSVEELDLDHPCFLESIREFSKGKKQDVGKIHEFLAQEVRAGSSYVRIINGLPESWESWFIEVFMPTNKLRAPFRREALRFLKEVVEKKTDSALKFLRETTQRSIGNLTYLPPVRELPPRGFDPSKRPEAAWKELAGNPDLVKRLNEWLSDDKMLGSSYTLENREFLPISAVSKVTAEFIKKELWDLLVNTNFARGSAELLQDASDEWLLMDKVSYVNANPELRQTLRQCEIDDGRAGDYWNPPYAELAEEERMDEASRRVDNCIINEYYDNEIFEHFINHNRPLVQFFDEFQNAPMGWSIDRASRRLVQGIENECKDRKFELSLVQRGSETRLALQDVGYGIGQFLPVLIHAFASKRQIIAIEQPEIHIHPRLQAELGDVFIESALGGSQNTLLLETHSEHLILRILRRIRETTEGEFAEWPEALRKACPNGIRPEDVAVLYVEPGEDGAKVTELPVTPDGDFSRPWPSGFFTERSKELY